MFISVRRVGGSEVTLDLCQSLLKCPLRRTEPQNKSTEGRENTQKTSWQKTGQSSFNRLDHFISCFQRWGLQETFGLKPPTNSGSRTWAPGDLWPPSHLHLDMDWLSPAENRWWPDCVVVTTVFSLLLMGLLSCSAALLLSRCVRRRGSGRDPLLSALRRQMCRRFIYHFKWPPREATEGLKRKVCIDKRVLLAYLHSSAPKALSSVSDTDAKLL